MSSHLYLFAPENDMALATGQRNYTPTSVVSVFARDLSLLPLWYAQEDEALVLSQQIVDDKMQTLLDSLGVTARVVGQVPSNVVMFEPWGWSAYMVHRLMRAGVDVSILPDVATIDTLRTLSGRATSRIIIQALAGEGVGYNLPPLPEVLTTVADVERYVTSQPMSMLKSPWSSSGRGVMSVMGIYDEKIVRAASGIIRNQGYIMGEKMQEKVLDFAMEFYSNGESVRFAGYSLFNTNQRGAYQGNMLMSDEKIENILSQYIDLQNLHSTRNALQRVLTNLVLPFYRGYMGVDMILYRATDGAILIHPCIELNLRMSMGMVSRIIADRYLQPDGNGTFMVEYYPSTADLQEFYKTMQRQEPLCIEGGKVVRGFLPLTPVANDTHYIAYILAQ